MGTSTAGRAGEFWTEADRNGDSVVVRAFGEVDLVTTDALRNALVGAFESDASSMTLDLTEVTFICSTGLQVLMWAAERSRQDGNRLQIRSGSGSVRRLIELCGVEAYLPLSA